MDGQASAAREPPERRLQPRLAAPQRVQLFAGHYASLVGSPAPGKPPASSAAALGPEPALGSRRHILAYLQPREYYVAVIAPVAAADRHPPALQHLLEARAGARNVHLGAGARRAGAAGRLRFGLGLHLGMAETVRSQRNQRRRAGLAGRSILLGSRWRRSHCKYTAPS